VFFDADAAAEAETLIDANRCRRRRPTLLDVLRRGLVKPEPLIGMLKVSTLATRT
jgi:hypothetical protein